MTTARNTTAVRAATNGRIILGDSAAAPVLPNIGENSKNPKRQNQLQIGTKTKA